MNDSEQLRREVSAVRGGAAVIARPEVRTLALTGPDRVRFLNGMVSNEVESLVPGKGVLALKTSNKGRVEALLRVRATEDTLFLDVHSAVADKVLKTLDQYIIMDDCAVRDVSSSREVISVFGARARELLAGAGLDPGELEEHAFVVKTTADVSVTVVRDMTLLLPGYELHATVPPTLDLNAPFAMKVSSEALEIARVEAGAPIDGKDLDEETFPMEARLERTLSLTKGCYIGQEVIARATNFGGVRHMLVGLVIEGDREPEEGAPLYANADTKTGEVTSVVTSPALGGVIALGYVRRSEEAPGTKLELASEKLGRIAATVRALPFVE